MSRLVVVGVLAVAAAGGGSAWYWTSQHRAEHTVARDQRAATAATAAYESQLADLIARLQAVRLGPTFRPAASYLGQAGPCTPGGITVGCWDTALRPPVAAHEIASALSGLGLGSATVRCDARPYCHVLIHNAAANSISYRLIRNAGATNVWAVAAR